MELRLFPEPTGAHITPYSLGSDGMYRCLDEQRSIHCVGLCEGSLVMTDSGAQRLPDRDRLLEWAVQDAALDGFGRFVSGALVVPTFSRSILEALVRVVMRQIVTRQQARSTIAHFIREYGVSEMELFGFPADATIRSLVPGDFARLGLGFRSARLVDAIAAACDEGALLGGRLRGVGPWSRAVLESDIRKDFSHYPMCDKSGQVAGRALGIDLEDLRIRDPLLAADLYVYALSWIEVEGRPDQGRGSRT